MRLIKKTAAPTKFQQYITQSNATFQDMDADVKANLRQSLFKEQKVFVLIANVNYLLKMEYLSLQK